MALNNHLNEGGIRMKKVFAILLVLVLSTCALCGCGGPSGSGGSNGGSGSSDGAYSFTQGGITLISAEYHGYDNSLKESVYTLTVENNSEKAITYFDLGLEVYGLDHTTDCSTAEIRIENAMLIKGEPYTAELTMSTDRAGLFQVTSFYFQYEDDSEDYQQSNIVPDWNWTIEINDVTPTPEPILDDPFMLGTEPRLFQDIFVELLPEGYHLEPAYARDYYAPIVVRDSDGQTVASLYFSVLGRATQKLDDPNISMVYLWYEEIIREDAAACKELSVAFMKVLESDEISLEQCAETYDWLKKGAEEYYELSQTYSSGGRVTNTSTVDFGLSESNYTGQRYMNITKFVPAN